MAEPEKKKRKREPRESDVDPTGDVVVGPRITYHTPFKSFERVFNETSLDETKRIVRAKLGLEPSVDVELAQLRGERKIVLEDEDDFHAFRIALRTNALVEVQVTLGGERGEGEGDAPATKKRKTKAAPGPTPSTNAQENFTPQIGAAAAYATPSTVPNAPFPAYSISSSVGGTMPPGTISIASSSHSKSTSPALGSPVLPFMLPVGVRTLPNATGVFGPTSTVIPEPGTSGSEEKVKVKEKPKRVRKKSEPAPSVVMSPAAREKAAAILERHRQAVADRTKPKNSKKKETAKEPETAPPPAPPTVEVPADDEEPEETEKPKKEKRKKKKKKHADDAEVEQEEQEEPDGEPITIPTSPKKQKKKDKGKNATAPRTETDIEVDILTQTANSKEAEGVTINVTVNTESGKSKQKLVPVITKRADTVGFTFPANKSEQPGVTKASISATTTTSTTSATDPKAKQTHSAPTGKRPQASGVCPFCRKTPFHLRFQCPLVKERGPALMKRLDELKRGGATGKETGGPKMVKEIEDWLETEERRDRLRAANSKSGASTRGKRKVDTPETDEEEEVKSEVNDPDATEDEDEDEDDRAESVPPSLGRPARSAHSLVAVQKPGEGSESTSTSEDEDQGVSLVLDGEDAEMHDASRESTPQANGVMEANRKATTETSSSSSGSKSPSPVQHSRTINASQSRVNNAPSTIHSPQSFRLINGEPVGVPDNAIHEQMERDAANVLVPDSDDSENEDLANVDGLSPNHAPMDEEILGALFLQRRSPVAKGRALGTPSRIQVMKDRHGHTAPVSRTYVDNDDEEDETLSPKAPPFPDHKLKAASQSAIEQPRKSFIPRLSDFSSLGFGLFKGGSATQHALTISNPPTPISVPRSGKTAPKSAAKHAVEDSSSSSSSDSESEGPSRIPKAQRASSGFPRSQKQSILSQF